MKLTTRLAGVAIGALALLGTATAASASTTHFVPGPQANVTSATTRIVDRPDSGGNGNWADDWFQRTATITSLGSAPLTDCAVGATVCYEYTATLNDHNGRFRTIPDAYTPNQSGAWLGTVLPSRSVSGQMSGQGGFTAFYADGTPSASQVPSTSTGDANGTVTYGPSGNAPSYEWPQLFFGSSVTLTSLNEATYNYGYGLITFKSVPRVIGFYYRHHHRHPIIIHILVPVHQHWVDADSNNGGQELSAGNITG